jgi:hypothetical protein
MVMVTDHMSHIEITIMVHQQALQHDYGERAPRTADELSKVCDSVVHLFNLLRCLALFVWWFKEF